jgi:hypothetical protein
MTMTLTGNGASAVLPGAVGTAGLANGAATPEKTQMGALPSMVGLNTVNGYGSTATTTRRYSNVAANQGADLAYVDSPTLGGSVTVLTPGVYAISSAGQYTVQSWHGITLNSSNPAASPSVLPAAEVLASGVTPGVHWSLPMSWTGYLPAGSVIRVQTSGGAAGTTTNVDNFTIARVA